MVKFIPISEVMKSEKNMHLRINKVYYTADTEGF